MRKYASVFKMMGMYIVAFIIGMYLEIIRPMIRIDMPKENFEIYQSFCFIFGDYHDTSIKVIVNIDEYDTENMFNEIKTFHNQLNGEPDKLEIRLYNSRNDVKCGNCVGNKAYYKE